VGLLGAGQSLCYSQVLSHDVAAADAAEVLPLMLTLLLPLA
jgi:hypothetical protein